MDNINVSATPERKRDILVKYLNTAEYLIYVKHYFNYLTGMGLNKFDATKKVWWFKDVPEVNQAIEEFEIKRKGSEVIRGVNNDHAR